LPHWCRAALRRAPGRGLARTTESFVTRGDRGICLLFASAMRCASGREIVP